MKATRVLVEQQRFAQTSGQSVCGDGAGHFTDGTSTDPADIFVDRWGIDSTSVLVPVAE